MIFYISITEPYTWVQVSKQGQVLDHGLVHTLSGLSVPSDSRLVVGVVPGGDVTCRQVAIPSRSRAKVVEALPFALEESLSEDIEHLHFALFNWTAGKDATVAIVARSRMDSWMDVCKEAGLKLDALVPDYLLLPQHPQTRFSIAKTGADDMLLVRDSKTSGLVLDQASLTDWWGEVGDPNAAVAVNDDSIAQALITHGGVNINRWDMGTRLDEWLALNATPSSANLLQSAYPPTREAEKRVPLWPAAAMVLLALCIKLGSDTVEYFQLRAQERDLNQKIVQVLTTTFPDIKRVVNPRLQMERRIAEVKSGYTGRGDFPILLGVVAKVLGSAGATLEDVNFKDNTMVITCTTRNFAMLDQLRRAFDGVSGVKVELESSGAREKQVSAKFRLRTLVI